MTGYHQNKSCVDACLQCGAMCNHCASSCLQRQDVQMMGKLHQVGHGVCCHLLCGSTGN